MLAVHAGMSCSNGKLINSSDDCEPIPYSCFWTGIHCTNQDGNERTNVCTQYYTYCSNGQVSSPLPVGNGLFCLDNSIVEASACAVGPDDSCTFCELLTSKKA